ncbi:transmembrane protein 200A-like [Brachionichthys hirsutus]|uniref:transmembrane protein 200A-like n=1 Tax=Brachionichthys hirsutus TaxID=412623 RepID=UPI003604689F
MPCFTFRGRKKKGGVIRGKLRIRSVPGAFVVLGAIVVVVGTGLAMAGYWPYRRTMSPESQTSDWRLRSAGFFHSEQMRLLGPVVMGVGLFILICANTVLYENRDRETQRLLAQMRSVLCSVSAAVPSADLNEIAAANAMAEHYQWLSSLPAAHLNTIGLRRLASSEPMPQGSNPRDQQEDIQDIYQLAVLQTEVSQPQQSKGPPSVCPAHSHSNSCHSNQEACSKQSVAEHGDSASLDSHPARLIKLNSRLVSAKSMSTLGIDEVVPVAPPRRCHSVSYRTNHNVAKASLCLGKGPAEDGHKSPPVARRRESASQACLNIPKQIDNTEKEQTHRSRSHLDLVSGRRHLKHESKENSMDKRPEQSEQQSSGSGPPQRCYMVLM